LVGIGHARENKTALVGIKSYARIECVARDTQSAPKRVQGHRLSELSALSVKDPDIVVEWIEDVIGANCTGRVGRNCCAIVSAAQKGRGHSCRGRSDWRWVCDSRISSTSCVQDLQFIDFVGDGLALLGRS
jgi:hypothetical protein